MEYQYQFVSAINVGKDELGNDCYNAVLYDGKETQVYIPEGGYIPLHPKILQLLDVFMTSPETDMLCDVVSEIRACGPREYSFDILDTENNKYTVFVYVHKRFHPQKDEK